MARQRESQLNLVGLYERSLGGDTGKFPPYYTRREGATDTLRRVFTHPKGPAMNRRSLFPLTTLPFLKLLLPIDRGSYGQALRKKGPFLSLGWVDKQHNPYAGEISPLGDHEGHYLVKRTHQWDAALSHSIIQHWAVPVTWENGYWLVNLAGLERHAELFGSSESPEALYRWVQKNGLQAGWL